ncbi:hypothetical protein [Amycolatopsis lurida]|uniref:Uncharacterized protein n=1 Tax=Amycolatopsis lurida NRRL 2430 TaxID=1460371 RepID=A0A2P2FVR4_AMYLU|nr:hypothetical protein [Amycolatopsis lurida]KFU80775.1 hypothetical protein BB31_12550 [Amycolatopsis lurida NRRL 2430]
MAFIDNWAGKRRPKQNIQLSPLLMNLSTNKYAVMNKMRAVADEHRSRNKDMVIFPEGRDEDGT